MFKDKMYRELREGLELYERARQDETRDPREKIQKEAILCEFLRNEKERDIRLAIKRYRVALKEIEKKGSAREYKRELEGYKRAVLNYLEQNLKIAKEFQFEEETFHELAEIDDVATRILELRKETGRKDPYIALQESYLDYQLGVLEEQTVYENAKEIFGANRKYRVRKEYKEMLKGSGTVSKGCLQGLNIGLLVDELSVAILVAQAKALLYDAGYPYDTGKNDEERIIKNAGRRRDQVMDLVDLYFERRGCTAMDGDTALLNGSGSDYRSTEFKKHCLAVYDSLQEDGREDICLPLYIDRNTGAGIYIIGRKCFDEAFLRDSKRSWQKAGKEGWEELTYHFCCLYWGEIRQDELVDVYAGFPVTILVDQVYGNDIDAVIEEYQFGLEQNYCAFKEINNEFPMGLDKRYRMYFEEVFEEDEDEIATVEEWNSMRARELREI